MRNVTALRACHEAATIDVCRANGKVALRANTREGVIVIVLTEVQFVKKFRGELDSNGQPFRTMEQISDALESPAERSASLRHAADRGEVLAKPGGKIL